VEQFWMAGWRAIDAKIVRRGNETAAELIVPQSIDIHAGRQRMFWIDEPAGEQRLRLWHISRMFSIAGSHQHSEHARADDLLRLFSLSALQNANLRPLCEVIRDAGKRRQRRRLLFLCFLELVSQPLAFVPFG